MERIKSLNRYQRVILLLLAAMLVVFTVAYSVVSSRVGFAYMGSILLPEDQGGTTIYAGRVSGENVRFTVDSDKTVTYYCGNKVYGPYTAREDSSAIPKDKSNMAGYMVGVEILKGGEVFFRGGVLSSNGDMLLYEEDGSFASVNVRVTSSSGIVYDSEGNVVDQMAPTPTTILRLMGDPKLTSKGEWVAWFCGVFLSAVTAIYILFADELFRWNLRFVIRNVDRAEPSDWEIMGRYIGWTVAPIMALVVYIMGLTT